MGELVLVLEVAVATGILALAGLRVAHASKTGFYLRFCLLGLWLGLLPLLAVALTDALNKKGLIPNLGHASEGLIVIIGVSAVVSLIAFGVFVGMSVWGRYFGQSKKSSKTVLKRKKSPV